MLEFAATDRTALLEYLKQAISTLARAGADFALLAANTPHAVFDDLSASSCIPLLSIVEASLNEARSLGCCRVGLLGTRLTMQGGFYADAFLEAGITVFAPHGSDLDYVHQKYVDELLGRADDLGPEQFFEEIAAPGRAEAASQGRVATTPIPGDAQKLGPGWFTR